MKHLFVVNPAVKKVKDRVNAVVSEIEEFFKHYSNIEYDIHITSWARDALGFVRRYAMSSEGLLRVHVMGGSGTLFEIVNGVIGLPNVQIAAYPLGMCNSFLRYFGADKTHMFSSLRNQVFSDVTAIDAIRCGYTYSISHSLIGLEAIASRAGTEMLDKISLPEDLCYKYQVLVSYLKLGNERAQSYKISLDGAMLDGKYLSMLIANGPCYGKNMNPASDAHPNDGRLEVYMIKDIKATDALSTLRCYSNGNYRKLPERVFHYSGKKIAVASDDIMSLSIDGETFFENSIEYEVIPYAIDFVCPKGIDVGKLPRVYGKSEAGACGEEASL